jgi:hypothetical protein
MNCMVEAEMLCGTVGAYPECWFSACNPSTECYESFIIGCQ